MISIEWTLYSVQHPYITHKTIMFMLYVIELMSPLNMCILPAHFTIISTKIAGKAASNFCSRS